MKITIARSALRELAACLQGMNDLRAMYGDGKEVSVHWTREEQLRVIKSPLRKYISWGFENGLFPLWPTDGLDLHGLDLSEMVFGGASWVLSNFSETRLDLAEMVQSNFTGANFAGASMTDGVFNGSRFDKADLSCADLSAAHLECASFSNADCSYAKFDLASLTGATFDHTNLVGATFDEAELCEVDFGDSGLDATDFTGAVVCSCTVSRRCRAMKERLAEAGWAAGPTTSSLHRRQP